MISLGSTQLHAGLASQPAEHNKRVTSAGTTWAGGSSRPFLNGGPAGIGIVEPVEPGPAAEALEHRRPGPFQVLYRIRSMSAAVRWMDDHSLPPPTIGMYNTGERALLVGPEHACVALVGTP